MDSSEISGIVVPTITPVNNEDQVDEFAFRALLQRLIKSGVQGVFVGGTTGEGPLLTFSDWERMAVIAFEECNGKIHLMCGTMDTSTRRIVRRIKILAQIGYNNFVVAPSFYINARLSSEHLRLFGECKEQSEGMNMIAYNIPSCTGSMIQSDVMLEMVRRGWVTCCKDSSEDRDHVRRLVSEGGPLGLRVLVGTELRAAEVLLGGAAGIVPSSANYEPSTFVSAYNARAHRAELMRLQIRITALMNNLLLAPREWLAGIKYAVSTLGTGSGRPVSPLEPLSVEERRAIDVFLQSAPAPEGSTH